jgi:hypothetical protein
MTSFHTASLTPPSFDKGVFTTRRVFILRHWPSLRFVREPRQLWNTLQASTGAVFLGRSAQDLLHHHIYASFGFRSSPQQCTFTAFDIHPLLIHLDLEFRHNVLPPTRELPDLIDS